MSREVKRVTLDFDWPMKKVWEGFLNPHYKDHCEECKSCGGSGYSPQAQFLHDQWYGSLSATRIFEPRSTGSTPYLPYHPAVRARAEQAIQRTPEYYGDGEIAIRLEAERLCVIYNSSWSHHLDEHDVAALLKAGRLMDFTHNPRTEEQCEIVKEKIAAGGNSWLPESNGYVPTPQEVNDWSINGFGHDSINSWVCLKAKAKRLKYPQHCATCKGEGSIWDSPASKHKAEHWKQKEPPKGKGYQMWETTSEGSPMSPVFATPEELAKWLADNGASSFGSMTSTYEAWLRVCNGGFAPSAVFDSEHGLRSGVEMLAEEG